MRKDILLLCYIASLSFGFVVLGYLYWQNIHDIDVLKNHLRQQKEEERVLIANIAAKDAQLSIKQHAYEGLKASLEQKTNESADQLRQLEFYRLIFESINKKQGIFLNDYEFKKSGDKAADISLTLINFNKKHEHLTGKISLTVSGLVDGQERSYNIDQLLIGSRSFSQKIAFKFYYIIEEHLVFPEGFKPSKLHISAQFDKIKPSQWDKVIDWVWEK